MRRKLAYISAAVALLGTLTYAGLLYAQEPAAAGSQSRGRIAVVNIAKVLRNFEQAKEEGKKITKLREDYIKQVNAKREEIGTLQKSLATAADAGQRDSIEKKITALQREIQDIDRQAQKTITKMTDEGVVKVYKQVKTVIDRIAVANNIELVLCYPDATVPEEMDNPVVARMMLQTPAAMPFYHRGLDITDPVIQTINKFYPASGVQPTGGTQE